MACRWRSIKTTALFPTWLRPVATQQAMDHYFRTLDKDGDSMEITATEFDVSSRVSFLSKYVDYQMLKQRRRHKWEHPLFSRSVFQLYTTIPCRVRIEDLPPWHCNPRGNIPQVIRVMTVTNDLRLYRRSSLSNQREHVVYVKTIIMGTTLVSFIVILYLSYLVYPLSLFYTYLYNRFSIGP